MTIDHTYTGEDPDPELAKGNGAAKHCSSFYLLFWELFSFQ